MCINYFPTLPELTLDPLTRPQPFSVIAVRNDWAGVAARASVLNVTVDDYHTQAPTAVAFDQIELHRHCQARLLRLKEIGWSRVTDDTLRFQLNCPLSTVSTTRNFRTCKLPYCPKCWMRDTEEIYDTFARFVRRTDRPRSPIFMHLAYRAVDYDSPTLAGPADIALRDAKGWVHDNGLGGAVLRLPGYQADPELWTSETRLLVLSRHNELVPPIGFETGPVLECPGPGKELADRVARFRRYPRGFMFASPSMLQLLIRWFPDVERARRHREILGKLRHNNMAAAIGPERIWVDGFQRVVPRYKPVVAVT